MAKDSPYSKDELAGQKQYFTKARELEGVMSKIQELRENILKSEQDGAAATAEIVQNLTKRSIIEQAIADRKKSQQNYDVQSSLMGDKKYQQELAIAEGKTRLISAMDKIAELNRKAVTDANEDIIAQEAIVSAMEKRNEQQKKNEEFFGAFKDKWDDFVAIAQDPKIATGAFVAAWTSAGVQFADTMSTAAAEIGMSRDQGMEMAAQLGGASISMTMLGIGGKQLAEAMGGLQAEFGGMANVSTQLVKDTAKMAKNYNMSGQDSAKLMYNAMQLSDNSEATAKSSLKTVENLARGANVPIGKVMTDVANSADLIAQFSYDSVEGLGKAAVEAAKMGTSLTQMAKTAENLMDLDNARTNAMQLSVLLGRQINIDRAQQLIYAGDLEGGYKEMLNQLGGIQAFNQMDYYQKAEAAKLMGVSVGELQKQLNLQAGLTETGEKQSKWWAATLSTAQSFWGGMKENAETIMASVNMVGAMGQGLASFAPAVGGFGTKMKDAFKGSGIGKFLGHGKEAPKKKQESPIPEMKTPEKGVGDRLKDLAKGLREMGKNTFKGILALALAGPAMVLAVPAIPFLLFMGLTPLQMLQTNLQGLGKGLSKIGEKAFLGATILGVLGVSGAIMVAAIPALLFIAIMGVPLQIGLQALGKGLSSLGSAAMNPYTWLGVVLLGAIGVALIPFGVALMFAGAGMGLFAAGLAMMMAMVPPIIEAVANAIVKIIGAFAQFVMTVSELPIEKLLIMGPALALLGIGFASLGIGMMLAMPSLLLLSVLGPRVFPVLGTLFDALAPAIKAVADAFSQILESAGGFFNILKEINPIKLIGLAYGMTLMGVSGVALLFGTYGIAAAGLALRVMAGALSLIPENFNMLKFAAGLGLMGAVGILLGPAAIGIGLFSLSLMGLSAALLMLTPFLPQLMMLATIGGGLFALAKFGTGGAESEGGDAVIKPTNATIVLDNQKIGITTPDNIRNIIKEELQALRGGGDKGVAANENMLEIAKVMGAQIGKSMTIEVDGTKLGKVVESATNQVT